MENARQLALLILENIDRHNTYTDVALDRVLKTAEIKPLDRALVTELVYGIVRRKRTLEALVDRLGKKPAKKQPPKLRLILYIGLYQLRYLEQIPNRAAVDTTVQLAKNNGLKGLSGVVNGILRQYLRCIENQIEPLNLSEKPIEKLGVLYSFPDWIIELWSEQFGLEETEKLCQWFNQTPHIDLRINPLKTTVETLQKELKNKGLDVNPIPPLPQALRLKGTVGNVTKLPGFKEGKFTIQDSSAQLVGYLLAPQEGEVIMDACAAPGGKATHLAELMKDNGIIWGCDRTEKRLVKVKENAQRLGFQCIKTRLGDSRKMHEFKGQIDRLLLDVPCSGLGTLHRHPDIRWQRTPKQIKDLTQLQQELLANTAEWVKPGGTLVYATCTLNPPENEALIDRFLEANPQWQMNPPVNTPLFSPFLTPEGCLKVIPHHHLMDGFFMVKLLKSV